MLGICNNHVNLLFRIYPLKKANDCPPFDTKTVNRKVQVCRNHKPQCCQIFRSTHSYIVFRARYSGVTLSGKVAYFIGYVVIKVQKAMQYTKMFVIPCSLSNHQYTVVNVGAGQEIQDGVRDGSHKQIQGCVLNDLLY